MEAYQFCFDHSGFAISEDCKWAQVDLNPAIGHGAQCDMMRMLMRRFPPAATVVLNFPVWQNTPEAQRNIDVTHRLFDPNAKEDKSLLFSEDAVWWNGLPFVGTPGQTEHKGRDAIRGILTGATGGPSAQKIVRGVEISGCFVAAIAWFLVSACNAVLLGILR